MSTDRSQRPEPLTPAQRQAIRLEIAGARVTDIAAQLGVKPQTVLRWRKLQEYRDHREMLAASSDADALDDARVLRMASSRVLRRGIRQLEVELDEGLLSLRDAAPALRVALDVYRSTSAQTGLSETSRHEVTLSAPEVALAEVRRMLTTAPESALIDIEESPGEPGTPRK
jgi:transposase-like protein